MESNTIGCADWEEFEARLAEQVGARKATADRSPDRHFSGFLFRGQRESSWGLESTLERSGFENMSLDSYYRSLWRVQPALETLLPSQFDRLGQEGYDEWKKRNVSLMHGAEPYGYPFMGFLRHHGFPSPLIDWSRSPYVAAFFAFADVSPNADRVAIYVYQERVGDGKAGSSSKPYIQTLGPYAVVHRRHVLQQSHYTQCVQNDAGRWYYVSHESAFGRPGHAQQDLLWKYTIPARESLKVLQRLDEHNLNAYSLFASDEALVKTLAFRELLSRPFAMDLRNGGAREPGG
ncbi:MAG: FRG domain-containing protein [Hydrogenophaga sp.]|nr:FRG domain-containing protein [Hydrogenophaga sp.]